MNDVDYKSIVNDAVLKLGLAVQRRDQAEIEITKLRQLISATVNMLPEQERAAFDRQIDEVLKADKAKSSSLVQAIRAMLQATSRNKWLTVSQMRNCLVTSGFDFSDYQSEPLASVSTTMKRMKPEEVETTSIEGVTAYRWKGVGRFPRLKKDK
jgi:hypothetical protein